MRAMVLEGVRQLRLREVPDPKPGPRDVVIKVAYCGVCMTDVHIYTGSVPVEMPRIMGHEVSGTVVETGSEVSRVSMGDRVAVNPIVNCGYCWHCIRGKTNLCENRLSIGGLRGGLNGAYAEYVKAPEDNVVKYDKDVSLRYAALTEPLACAVHAVDLARVSLGDVVVVIGAGPMGLMLTQLLLISGASKVIVLDLKDERLRLAEQLGASHVINPQKADPLKSIKEITDGDLADIVIEAVGSISAIQDAFRYIRTGGRMVIFGVPPRDALASFLPFNIYFKEQEIIGSHAVSKESFIRAAKLISQGKISLEELISEIYDLEDLEKALIRAERGEGLKKLICVAKED